MRTDVRTAARTAMAAGALVVAGIAIPTAAPQAQGDPPVLTDEGFLRLHVFGAGGTVTWEQGGATLATQTVTTNRCGVSLAGAALLTLTPSTGSVGLVSNGLGVRTRNNCGTAEGRIGAGERLTVELGSNFAAAIGITSAELDIEGKFGARLGVTLDGVALTPIVLANGSDNGPDSGPADNTRTVVAAPDAGAPFRSMALSAAAGEVSLEGGGDYSATPSPADTIFHLASAYDRAVDCNDEPVVAFGGTGDAASEATFARALNDGAASPDDCEDIPVTLVIRPDGVILRKTTIGLENGTPQAVNSTMQITWSPQDATVPLPAREIDFDGDPNGGPFVFENVQWCTGLDAGDPIHPPDARFDGTASGGLLPWCLVSETTVLKEDGTIVQTQLYDGYGDPMYR